MVDNLTTPPVIFDIKELKKIPIEKEKLTIFLYDRLEIAHNNHRYVFDLFNEQGLKIGSFHFEYSSISPKEVNLVHRWLEKDYRERGYSVLIFDHAISFLAEIGYSSITLNVGQVNVYGWATMLGFKATSYDPIADYIKYGIGFVERQKDDEKDPYLYYEKYPNQEARVTLKYTIPIFRKLSSTLSRLRNLIAKLVEDTFS